ncbi:uncharacterized protein [Apostichopus japonicus]|uniref:uncharacterized protein isoform X1 n=1 Tax=Stichopus japonicus TaxID=307972 RepID=UPI003AB6FEEB
MMVHSPGRLLVRSLRMTFLAVVMVSGICVICSSTKISLNTDTTNRKEACGPTGVCDCSFADIFTNVYCRDIQPHEVPRDIPSNATFLYIIMSEITRVPVDAFWNLTHLEELNLNENQIQEIPNLAFYNLTMLKVLELQNNKLRVLSPDVFARLPNLESLRLDHNQLQSLSSNIFENLTNLKHLYLQQNIISTLPGDIFRNLGKLSKLGIFDNMLKTLPSEIFQNSTSLVDIDLSLNNITSLPATLFSNLIQMEYLDLNENEIEILPDVIFADLHNLISVSLSGNPIATLPDELLFGLLSLYSVAFEGEKLEVIPESLFYNQSKLAEIFFRRNQIISVPERLFRGMSIGILSLSGNHISSLPEDLFENTTIYEALDLADNQLTEFPTAIIKANETMQFTILFLQSNRLTSINSGSFDNLINLRSVYLSDNSIHTVHGGDFNGPKLESIYLFANQLVEIIDNPFTGDMIKEVHLYGNNIRNLSNEFVTGVSNESLIFLNCASLSELPQAINAERMKCVNPQSLPELPAPLYHVMIFDYFQRSGFDCKLTTCVACRPGTYANRVTIGCLPCPIGGFYQDGIGQLSSVDNGVACKQCNKGTYVKSGGGSSTKDCEVCPGGTNQSTFAGYRACPCKEDYARTDRYGPCTLCQEDGVNCSADFKTLLPGYTWNWNFPDANLSNYERFITNLKQETHLLDSYTSYNETFPVIFQCPRKDSCANDDGNIIEGSCAEGYKGWLCSNCQRGYYSVLNVCMRCPSLAILITETCAFFLVCVVILLLLLWQKKEENNVLQERRTILDVLISRIKILLGFYQVVGEIFTSFHDINWTGPLVIIGSFISSLEMNILKLFVRPRCYDDRLVIDPKIEFFIGISLPIAIIILPSTYYLAKKVVLLYRQRFASANSQWSIGDLRSRSYTFVIVVLFIIYPGVCSSIFQLYPRACKTFFLDEQNRYFITRLRSNLDISCDNLGPYHYLAYFFTAVYVIAFPATLLYILWKRWQPEGEIDQEQRTDSADDGEGLHINRNGDDDDDSCNDMPDENTPLLRIPTNRCGLQATTSSWLIFLCENYKEQYWFWEVIELTRKVSQTLLITLFGWEDRLTVLLTTCISVVFLVLHARYRPMKSSYEQGLQMLSLAVIFINVLVAANEIPENYEGPVSTILIFLNILVIVIITGEVICIFLLHIKHMGLRSVLSSTMHVFRNSTTRCPQD